MTWTISPASVRLPEAGALLRDYYTEVADRYRLLHLGRRSTRAELDEELADIAGEELAVFLLGSVGGEPAGCAGLRLRDPDTVELTRVFVRPRWRGTGGGARLLEAVDSAADDLGAPRIVLDTRLDLIEARALYLKHGYREIPAYNRQQYAEVWYGKEL
ncbi:GNAT family N-acetyltransferase [Pseudonocardiaceae bacterium YIM PH 21723]|nr:GNAT family N-acetyltransferase [Pseudonocardiaceae bacterium YIM PH 21723]